MAMLDQEGFNVCIENGVLRVFKGSLVVINGRIRNGIYVLYGTTVKDQTNANISDEDLTMRWRRTLGRVSYGKLKLLSQSGVLGKVEISLIRIFEQCILGETTKVKFGKERHKTEATVDYLHLDLWGPSRILKMRSKVFSYLHR